MTTGGSTTGAQPARVRIAAGSNRVSIATGAAFAVSGKAAVSQAGDRVTIDRVRSALDVTVPEGTDVVIGTSSGRVDSKGVLGAVAVATLSGRVDVESAASLDVRTASGRVTVGAVAGTCRIHVASGRVRVGGCGAADVSTMSGRVVLDEVDGVVNVQTVSGRIDVGMCSAADVNAETVSGRIELRMPRAETPKVTAGAPLPPPGREPVVRTRSATGRVVVTYE